MLNYLAYVQFLRSEVKINIRFESAQQSAVNLFKAALYLQILNQH